MKSISRHFTFHTLTIHETTVFSFIGFVFFSLSAHLGAHQNKMRKLGQELFALEKLVDEFEMCIGQQKEQLKQLKVCWGLSDQLLLL